jgi:hypothetical protein
METTTALQAAREIVTRWSWRKVRGVPEGPLNKPPDPHFYQIGSAPEIDQEEFWRFVRTIREHGRRGRYVAPYNTRTLYNTYLVIDEYVYWFVRPMMLNRTLVEFRQHTWLDESTTS